VQNLEIKKGGRGGGGISQRVFREFFEAKDQGFIRIRPLKKECDRIR
jgi:hypothetical protein